jgi:hypothetical protein
MSRQELVQTAKEMGITKPQTIKSEVLIKMISETPSKESKQRGRKINPESTRQKRLVTMEAKREAGLLKKGRPSNPESSRQKRLAERQEKLAAGTLKKGRPAKQTTK